MHSYGICWQTPNHLITIAMPRGCTVKDYGALRTEFTTADSQKAALDALGKANGESRPLGGEIYFWTQKGPGAPKEQWHLRWDMHLRNGFEDAMLTEAAAAFIAVCRMAGVEHGNVFRGHTYIGFEGKMWEENAYNAEIVARIERAKKVAAEKPASPDAIADLQPAGKA